MINNSMLKMSLFSSLAGLTLLYAGAVQMRPGLTPISKIDNDFVGLKTQIRGQIINLRTHSKGHVFLKVKDESNGVISIPIFSRTKSKLNENIELLDNIQVTGKVKDYQGNLELLPETPEKIKIFHSQPSKISEINRESIGEKVKIQGNLTKKRSTSGGSLVLELENNHASLKVFVPQSTANSSNFPRIEEKNKIRIAGTIQLYKNELELKVHNPCNIRTIKDSR